MSKKITSPLVVHRRDLKPLPFNYFPEINRETGMIDDGVKKYQDALNKAVKKDREGLTAGGRNFLYGFMPELVEAVKGLQSKAIKDLGKAGDLANNVPLVCIDAESMALATIWQTFAYRHKSKDDDAYIGDDVDSDKGNGDKDKGNGNNSSGDGDAKRPLRSLCIALAGQLVRERQRDVWAAEERGTLNDADKPIPAGLPRSLRNVAEEVEAWIIKNIPKERRRKKKRLDKIRQIEKDLASIKFNGIANARGSIDAAAQLLGLLVKTFPKHFENRKKKKKQKGDAKEGRVYFTAFALDEIERFHKEMALPLLKLMILPPEDWQEDPDSRGYVGGYLKLIDLGLLSSRSYLLHSRALEHPVGDQTLRAVNTVQATAWQVNPRVADALRLLEDSPYRKEFGLGPERVKKIPFKEREEKLSPDAKSAYERQVHEEEVDSAHLNIARRLFTALEEDEAKSAIWFPHFLDFRGRMYSYPQDLNPQASDPVRACLQFAEGKLLGEFGEQWLARRLPATYGGDVASKCLREQFQWVDEHKQEILRLARNPLGEIEFWKGAKKKSRWQFYAACCEWAAMHEQGSRFVSHLPVAMDGRCNGLQHLAALVKDPLLGKTVNLTPSDVPQDVYREIADELVLIIDQDTAPEAAGWKGLIDRDTIKPAVMTIPYGVTMAGIREQIMNGDAVYQIHAGVAWYNAQYLADKIWNLIHRKHSVLAKTMEVLVWLSKQAKIFAKANVPMLWTNPADMNIRMAYFTKKSMNYTRVDLHQFGGRVSFKLLIEDDGTEKKKKKEKEKEKRLNARDQAQGITASVVHSFDAAHLAKTVNACHLAGIRNFAVIHDSYGTHACDAPVMARLLREQFVGIYSQDWLGYFAEQWSKAPGEVEIAAPPAPDNLDISSVTDSGFFFC